MRFSMLLRLQNYKKAYVLANLLFLYINVLLTFSVIYLFLDVSQLGPIVNPIPIFEQKYIILEKVATSIYLSTLALLSEGYSHIVPAGWSKIVVLVEATIGFMIPAFMIVNFFPLGNLNSERTSITVFKILSRFFFVTLGALFVAVSLEIFLVPNKIIDGGIVGISIMLSYLTGLKLELFLLLLNSPFLYLGYKQMGKKFVVTTLLGICILSIGTLSLYNVPVPTDNPIIAAILGGAFLGIGVGMVIRYGGSLDGTEILGILLNQKTSFSVGKFVMIINIFIFISAGFIFGWDKAMYSILAFYIASFTIDWTIDGFRFKKTTP
jgi:hypothetical protein